MLQKELAKRLRGRFETEPDGNGWPAVSSDGMPLCQVKYNGNCIVNDNPYLSEEYLGKIAEVQDELLPYSKLRTAMKTAASHSKPTFPYIYLADRVNESGECWPAIPTIAADLKYSPSTVRRGIRDLKKAGLLTTEQRYRKKGGKSSLLFRLKAE